MEKEPRGRSVEESEELGKAGKRGSLRGGTLEEGLQRERAGKKNTHFSRCERAHRYVRERKCLKGTVRKRFYFNFFIYFNPLFYLPPCPTVTNSSHPRNHYGGPQRERIPAPTQWKLTEENLTRLNLYSQGAVLFCRATHTNMQHKRHGARPRRETQPGVSSRALGTHTRLCSQTQKNNNKTK